MKKESRSILHFIMNFLASLHLGIALLIIVAVAGICGSLIPQGQPLIYYQDAYGHALGSFMFYVGLTAVYKSSWFIAAVLTLLLNLSACTYRRCIKNLPQLNWWRACSALLHLGLVAVIVGGLVSGFFGKSHYFEVPVNGIVQTSAHGYPFDLRVDNFEIDYYPQNEAFEPPQPKQYRSVLTVLKDGQELHREEIKVNHPLNFQGTKVYQANYGWLMQGKVTNEGKTKEFKISAGKALALDDHYLMKAIPASSDMTAADNSVLYSLHWGNNQPFLGRAELNEKIELPCGTVQFTAVKPFTGLEVKQDHGVPIVMAGFVLTTVGIILRLWVCKS